MTERITGNYIHQLFCETMEIDMAPLDKLTVHSLDEFDYEEALDEEGIDDAGIASQYKEFKDGHIEMYVNEDKLNDEPYQASEVVLSQLFDLYAGSLDLFKQAYETAKNVPLINVTVGYYMWMEFASSYMATKIHRQLFDAAIPDMGEEMQDGSMAEKYREILKNICSGGDEDMEKEQSDEDAKLSAILYLFGKLAYYDTVSLGEARFAQIKKPKTTDIKKLVEGKPGSLADAMYQSLIKSLFSPVSALGFRRLQEQGRKLSASLGGAS